MLKRNSLSTVSQQFLQSTYVLLASAFFFPLSIVIRYCKELFKIYSYLFLSYKTYFCKFSWGWKSLLGRSHVPFAFKWRITIHIHIVKIPLFSSVKFASSEINNVQYFCFSFGYSMQCSVSSALMSVLHPVSIHLPSLMVNQFHHAVQFWIFWNVLTEMWFNMAPLLKLHQKWALNPK